MRHAYIQYIKRAKRYADAIIPDDRNTVLRWILSQPISGKNSKKTVCEVCSHRRFQLLENHINVQMIGTLR